MTRVLLVDDDEDLATLLCEQLSRMGLDVRPAFSLAEAKACAAAERFDVLVSDGHLFDGGAEEVARAVPARLRVLLSGSDRTREGFELVLLKPTTAQTLADAITSRINATP
jgi:DNA-binding NtrC family response regulator